MVVVKMPFYVNAMGFQ